MRTALLARACAAALAAAGLANDDAKTARDPFLEMLLQAEKEGKNAPAPPPALIVEPARKTGTEEAPAETGDPDKPDPKLERVLDRMNAARKKLETLESKLVKTRLAPLISDVADTHTGELKFKSPRLLFMELKGPRHIKPADQRTSRTIVTGRFAYVWRVEDNEAERFKLPDMKDKEVSERNPFEYGLAADVRGLKRDYYLRLLGEERLDGRKTHKIRARPRPRLKDSVYKELVFWVDDKLMIPVQFRQVKSDGQIVDTYRLKDVKVNPWWIFSPFKAPPSSVNLIQHDLAEPKR
jgi:outer membrane lipoprotein-sorting protein